MDYYFNILSFSYVQMKIIWAVLYFERSLFISIFSDTHGNIFNLIFQFMDFRNATKYLNVFFGRERQIPLNFS